MGHAHVPARGIGEYDFTGPLVFVDGTAAFDESAEPSFVDEVHLTARGNELLAAYVAEAAIRQIGRDLGRLESSLRRQVGG